MSVQLSDFDWIVIPRHPSREAWIGRLAEAAAAAGRAVHDWDAAQTEAESPGTLMLTALADVARAYQPDASRVAAIDADLDVVLADDLPQQERHEEMRRQTDGFAQVAALPHGRRFGRTAFGPSAEILPGLHLTAPAPAPAGPLKHAMSIFTTGESQWAPEIFSRNARRLEQDEGFGIDLTGRPRILLFGPYVVMPAGTWTARFQVAFDGYAARYLYRMDWGGVEQYASHELRPGKPGVYEFEMTFDWVDRGPAEFRILVLEGVFHGELTLSPVDIRSA